MFHKTGAMYFFPVFPVVVNGNNFIENSDKLYMSAIFAQTLLSHAFKKTQKKP